MPSFNSKFSGGGGALVVTDLEVDGTTLVVDETNNRVGIGDGAPGTTLQVKGTAPYVTIQNSTSENTSGGCESKLIFEDHGNNALGQVEVSHVGTADDEKGQLIIKTNNDSGLQTALTISEAQLATFAASVAVTTDLAVDGVSNLDNTDIDGTLVVDGSNISLDSTSTLNIDNSNTTNGITIGTATSSVPVSIGHTTSETTVNDNLTVTGDLTVNGTTTTINSTTLTVDDKVVVIASGAGDSAAADGAGISVDGASATFLYDHTGTQWEMNKPLEVTGAITSSAAVVAVSLDISGDCDIDGTMEADAITVDGTALNTVIAGVTVTNATNATNSTNATNATNSAHVLVTDNESTAEENLITFVEGATSTTGNVGLEMDGHLTYNPSTGTVSATVFKGNIDAVDGDFDGTLEADAITVGGTALNTVIAGVTVTNATNAVNATNATNATNSAHVLVTDNESTSEENLITFVEGGTSGTGNVGLEMDGHLTYNPSSGTVTATIFKGNIDAVDGDFDGTLEADAITVGGTALNTVIAGVTVTNATNAVNSTHVTVADNESTNEENLIPFIEDASATGNVGLESDGDFAYNPSTGTVTATIFKGNIDAVDGDFDGTLEADAITVGGTNLLTGGVVTSLGTIAQDTVLFSSANSQDPLVQIKNTTNDANGARLQLIKDRGAAAQDNDVVGVIEFVGDDDNQDQTLLAKIQTEVADASNNAEGGRLMLGVATHDGEMQFGLVIEDGDAEDEIDVITGNGTLSTTTAAGYSKATSGFLVPEGKSVHIETPMLASADHTATGITTLMTASENIAQGELVYASGDGTIGVADADAVAKMPAIGLAVAAISSGNPGAILLQGMFRDDSYGFTAGNRLFVHTDGTVTATAPSGNGDVAQAVGVALEPDVIYFSPDMTLVEITA